MLNWRQPAGAAAPRCPCRLAAGSPSAISPRAAAGTTTRPPRRSSPTAPAATTPSSTHRSRHRPALLSTRHLPRRAGPWTAERPRAAPRSLRWSRSAHVGSWAGLLAVGDLIVGDELGVAHLGADLGEPAGRAEGVGSLGEEGRVGGGEVLPLGGHVVLVEDGLDRADGLAGAAVHALVGVDVEHAVALVDAVDRTLLDARLVLHVNAGLGDDVGHLRVDPLVATFFGLLDTIGSPTPSTSAPVTVDPTPSLAPPSSGSSTAPATTASPATTLPGPSRSPSTTTPRATVNTGSNDDAIDAQADPTRAMPARKAAMARAVPTTAMAAAAA